MRRKTIIIGSPLPVSTPGHLRGVKEDVSNIYNCSLSSVLGADTHQEIMYFENPKARDLRFIQNSFAGYDIVKVFYSGHGGMHKGIDYLQINSSEVIPVSSLYSKANRQLTFIDACRTDMPWLEYGDVISGIGLDFDTSEKALARRLFDHYIQNSPYGHVTTFSSSTNQASQDTEDGGLYTFSLMNALLDWYNESGNVLLNINGAFRRSFYELRKTEWLQTPQQMWIHNKEALKIPFAVNPHAYKEKLAAKKAQGIGSIQSSNKNLLEALLLLGGTALVIKTLND